MFFFRKWFFKKSITNTIKVKKIQNKRTLYVFTVIRVALNLRLNNSSEVIVVEKEETRDM
jgi:hypothetical protein